MKPTFAAHRKRPALKVERKEKVVKRPWEVKERQSEKAVEGQGKAVKK